MTADLSAWRSSVSKLWQRLAADLALGFLGLDDLPPLA